MLSGLRGCGTTRDGLQHLAQPGHRHEVVRERASPNRSETPAWADSGLGAPTDVDQLQGRIAMLEQELAEVRNDLGERTEELAAARGANRELTRALNQLQPG